MWRQRNDVFRGLRTAISTRFALSLLLLGCSPEASDVDVVTLPVTREIAFIDVASAVGLTTFGSFPVSELAAADRFAAGVCVLDVDGAPPYDLFFARRPIGGRPGAQGSRLYVAGEELEYVDETEARGLSDVGDATACLAFDADGDGDDDLFVPGHGTLRLLQNERGQFVDRSAELDVIVGERDWYQGAAAGDVDGDGDLDIVVAGYLRDVDVPETPEDCPNLACSLNVFSERRPRLPNLLLLRGADGRYLPAANELAEDLYRDEPTLMVAVVRVTGRGRPDIVVGNDFPNYPDRVLRRDSTGALRDVAVELGMSANRRGSGGCTMGFNAGDINGDGVLDFASSSYQGEPSSLFVCDEVLGFCGDRSAEFSLGGARFRWGVQLVDVDGDGRDDLVEVGGHLYRPEDGPTLANRGPFEQPAELWLARDARLVRWEAPNGDGFATPRAGRGLVAADLDDDGRVDFIVSPAVGMPAVLLNRTEPRGHFLRVSLVGAGLDTEGAAARVTVTESDGLPPHIRARLVGDGYAGNGDPRLLFGLRTAGRVSVEVRWADDTVTTMRELAADGDVTVEQ